jgi:hypothetical protein
MKRDAVISKCGKYRYSLVREWDESKGKVLFIMLNPSIADAEVDDPTIKRCISFSKNWGYGGLMVANLFAYITPYPKELFAYKYPEGNNNRKYIEQMMRKCEIVICAWGKNQGSPPEYLKKLSDLYYLKLLSDGKTAGHPLYLKKELKPKKFI